MVKLDTPAMYLFAAVMYLLAEEIICLLYDNEYKMSPYTIT